MNILALDIATVTGCAFGQPRGKPRAWAIDLGKGRTEDARFAKAIRMTQQFIDRLHPDLIAVEAPVGGRDANAYLIGLVACVRGIAAANNVRCVSYFPSTVRKHFIGKAMTARDFPGMNAAKGKLAIKNVVLQRCKLLGWEVDSLDAADAAALWDYACGQESLPHQMTTVGGLFK